MGQHGSARSTELEESSLDNLMKAGWRLNWAQSNPPHEGKNKTL
jgi:hypothetical protein